MVAYNHRTGLVDWDGGVDICGQKKKTLLTVIRTHLNLETQHNSLYMHIKMHYTPTTTHPTASHNPSLHTTNKHKAHV